MRILRIGILFPLYLFGISGYPFTEAPASYDSELAVNQPYFIARRVESTSPVTFKLYPIYEKTYPENFEEDLKNPEEKIFLDNAFRLEYSLITQKTGGMKHSFAYDALLRIRELTRHDEQGHEVLSITFSESGGLVSIRETIPEEISLEILFNPNEQMAVKTISTPEQVWQYRYRYRNGRLARVVSYYNQNQASDRIITWESISEEDNPQRELQRIEALDLQGKKIHSWEIERDLTLAQGEGEEVIGYFPPYRRQDKPVEKTLRLWIGGRIIEEHVTRDQLYHRNLYRYDDHGLLEEKSTWDAAGKVIARHHYRYRLPQKVKNMVFLEQLKLNTLETTQYLLGDKLLLEQKKLFHLQNLVESSHEEVVGDNHQHIWRSYAGGLDTVVNKSPTLLEISTVEPQASFTLSGRKIHYDDFGRIQEVILTYPHKTSNDLNSSASDDTAFDGSYSKIRFFYEAPPPLSKVEGKTFFPQMESYNLGNVFLDYLRRRQELLKNVQPLSLEKKFEEFSVGGRSSPFEEEVYLLSQLKMFRALKLRKIISYDRGGKVNYYYRIEQDSLNSEIQTTRFTYYPQAPTITLLRSRIKTILNQPDRYIFPGFTSATSAMQNPNYSYLGLGGNEEFHSQAIDNLDPNLEKPQETIIIRFTENGIMLDGRQILYNHITHQPEKEIIILGKKTLIQEIDSFPTTLNY